MKILLSFVFLTISNIAFADKTPSTIIYDLNKEKIVDCKECNTVRPIASLTKVMTALVALEHDSDFGKSINVGGGSKLPPGVNTRGDLFTAMLVRSDNQSAEILAQNYPGGRKAFMQAMNDRARSLGMINTKFVDPTGLGSGNVSTVEEVTTMIKVASLQPIIADTSILTLVEIKNKKYKVILENTNKLLLADFNEIKFSKTGFTNAAGWSVGMILERHGQRFLIVILGAKDKIQRYNLAKSIIQKYFADIEYEIELEKQKTMWQKVSDWIKE